MGTFSSSKIIAASPAFIPTIAQNIEKDFTNNGYEVKSTPLSSGGYDISITKGGIFKAVLGMKTALKVTILPEANAIKIDAGVGIWGAQAVPTVISMLFFWPVLITQIWGMVEQSSLDDRVISIAEQTVASQAPQAAPVPPSMPGSGTKFCTACGTQYTDGAKFCSGCGKQL